MNVSPDVMSVMRPSVLSTSVTINTANALRRRGLGPSGASQ